MSPPAKGYFRDARLLSVHELRKVLQGANVDYSSAVEKADLVDCAIAAGLFFDWRNWTPFPLADLPEELQMHIFSFLGVAELVQCCLVSHSFAAHAFYAADDSLWLGFCQQRWRGKFHTRKDLRRVDTPDGKVPRKLLYAQREIDARRRNLLEEELVRFPWLFVFKHFDHSRHPHPVGRWTADKTITIDGLGTMNWRWIQEGALIQVEQYPYLKVSRTPDWGWQLENHYVIFTAMDPESTERSEAAKRKAV